MAVAWAISFFLFSSCSWSMELQASRGRGGNHERAIGHLSSLVFPSVHAKISLDEGSRGTIGKFRHDVLDLVLAWESGGGVAIGLLPQCACVKIWRAVIGLLYFAEIEMLLGITVRRRVSHRVEARHLERWMEIWPRRLPHLRRSARYLPSCLAA